ncbi:MAG: DUF2516 family protein [Mycobacteriales bacterium]
MTPANLLLAIVYFGCLALVVWAVIDCITRPTAAFPVAGKLTKPAWLAITLIGGVVLYLFGVLSLGLAGVIAAIVYLVDVRPAVRAIQNGGSRW